MLPRERAVWESQTPSFPLCVGAWGHSGWPVAQSSMPSGCGNLGHQSNCAQLHHYHQVRNISKASEGMAIYSDRAISHF